MSIFNSDYNLIFSNPLQMKEILQITSLTKAELENANDCSVINGCLILNQNEYQ